MDEELLSLFMITRDEMFIIGTIVLILIVLSFILPRIAFFLYTNISSNAIQDILKEIIYYLDKFADDLSNKQKRVNAVSKLQAVFSFKGIRIPGFILGWIVDIEVRQIRRLQAECSKDTNLHNENEDD